MKPHVEKTRMKHGAHPFELISTPRQRKLADPRSRERRPLPEKSLIDNGIVPPSQVVNKLVTLDRLLSALERERPGLVETQRRLAGVLVRYHEAANKKPKFKRMTNPVLILDPFYILPPKLLDACMKVLPVGNTPDTAVHVDTPSHANRSDGKVDVVQIKDVGAFSRLQVEVLKRVEILKQSVQLGLEMHKWLLEDGFPSLPAEYHEAASSVADRVLRTYPHSRIDGLGNHPEYKFAMLYRATPPTWLNDASIRALCERLVNDFPSCRFVGFQDSVVQKTRTRSGEKAVVSDNILAQVRAAVDEDGVTTVLLPLNFHNAHWCCIVVGVRAKTIWYYDPLNQSVYINSAKTITTYLKHRVLESYDVVGQNSPIQFDSFSCGVYVCWMCIRKVTPGPALDMGNHSLPMRRFELFYYILTGIFLPLRGTITAEDDGTEEKAPPDDDDIPHTQVAPQ